MAHRGPEHAPLTQGEIRNLVETSAYVDDLDRAERFYRDVLGLSVMGREQGRHVFFRVGDADVLLLFLADETLKGLHLPAHGARGPGHFALGIDAEALDDWRRRLFGPRGHDRAGGGMAAGRTFPLFPRPRRQLGRADHPGPLGIADGLVTAALARYRDPSSDPASSGGRDGRRSGCGPGSRIGSGRSLSCAS